MVQEVKIVGPSGSITVGGDNNEFQNSLKNKSDDDLKAMLKDGNLTPEQKQAVIEELAKHKSQELDAEGGPDAAADKKTLQELMQKLKSGRISDDEKEKLAGMLGVDVKDMDKIGGGGGGQPNVEIKGPSGSITVTGQ
jgi:hypothetical protein